MIFSIVKLTTNTGISDWDLMIGTPNVDDVKRSKMYKELIEDCGGSKFILVTVRSVETKSKDVKLINESRYAIIPCEEITMKGSQHGYIGRKKR